MTAGVAPQHRRFLFKLREMFEGTYDKKSHKQSQLLLYNTIAYNV